VSDGNRQENPMKKSRLLVTITTAALALLVCLPATAVPPPAPWVTRDIGDPPRPGMTDLDAGIWTIQGNGTFIFSDVDQFHFAYLPIRGDGSISARFLSRQGGNADWSRAGLMIRENDTAGAANLNFAMGQNQGLLATERPAQGAFSEEVGVWVGSTNRPEPGLFMRLQRVGNEIAGFYSRDGLLWTQAAFPPRTLPSLKEEALFGLAVTSWSSTSTTAKFDQVSAQPGLVSVYGAQACGGDRSVLLQWRRLPSAVSYNVYRGPMNATRDQFTRINTDAVPQTSFTDTSAGLVNGTPVQYAIAPVLRGADGAPVEGPAVSLIGMPVAVPGLTGCSINEGHRTGSAAIDAATGVITITGVGWNPPWSVDQAYFLNRIVEGDAQITVRMLTRPTGGGTFRMAGLMVRESLDADARHFQIGIRPALPGPGFLSGIVREWRDTSLIRKETFLSADNRALQVPVLLRLIRRGNTITPSFSRDEGKTFEEGRVITFSPPLPRALYVGMSITAGSESPTTTTASRATFRDFTVIGLQ
jgi:hypothetical protein